MHLAPLDALRALTADTAARLRAHFADVGFTETLLGQAEDIMASQLDALRLPFVRWHLERFDTAGADLALMAQYDTPLPEGRARRALGPVHDDVLSLGLVGRDAEGRYTARFRITALSGLWFVCDDLAAGGDAAMGPGATTADLLDLVPEPCTERFLDVGCGAGTLALLAAARGADATGTDINPRAIALSEFNATLNGLTARFVVGDLLAPVAGEHFDRVVSQPPFVMQRPGGGDATFLFGGPWGDELTQRLLSALPAVLSPGGVALVRIDSLGRPGDPLPTRVRKLVGAASVDVVTLLTRGMNLDQLCMGYASLEDPTLGPAYERAARDFRTHVADLGARNAVQALVCLYRRRDDRPGGAAVGLPVTTLRRADADTVAALFDALPRAQAPDATLLGLRLALHPGAHFTETRDGPDRAEPPKLTLSFAQGLCGESQLSENSLGLLECIVAGGTLAEAVARYAEMVEAPVAAVTPEALRFVREGLVRQMLVLAS